MKKDRSTILKFTAGIGISILCLYFALRGIDFPALARIFMTVKVPYLILFGAILMGAVFLRALLYYRFLKRQKQDISYFSIYEGLIIGYMVNSIFPLRAGDIVKAYIIGKLNGVSKTYTFILAVIERLFDLVTLLIFFTILLWIIPLDTTFRMAARMLACIAGAAVIFIIFAITCGDYISALVEKSFLSAPLKEKIKSRLQMVQSGFKILCRGSDLLFIQVLFLGIWGSYILVSYVTGLAVGITMTFPMILFLLVAVALGTAIVSSPGGLGVHQYACVLVFSYFGISREQALSFSLIQNTLSLITPVVLGWIFLLHTNISLASLQEDMEEKPSQEEASAATETVI